MAEHKAKPGKEIGGTGTIFVGGVISGEEYNRDLAGLKGLQIIDQMRKGDATVRASLMSVKLPIRATNWFIKPASDDPKDIEIAEFIDQNLFKEMTITWADFLRQALLHLDYGRMVFEIVYKQLDDGRIGWHKFAPRLPATIFKWQTEDNQDGVTQFLPTGGYVSIPIEKLIIFVNDKEGDNWEGISLIRPAYKHWYIKDSLYKIDALAFERQGLGIPFVKPPLGANLQEEDKAEELLKNLRANEESHLKIPQGWGFGFMDMNAGSLRNIQPTILHHDRQIVKNVLAQFLELGASGASGSFALSQDQSRLFLLSLQAVARHIAEAINKFAIPRLVDFNFEVKEYPELDFAKIGQVDFDKLSTALQRLSQSGVLTPDEDLEAHIRETMELPEMMEDADDDDVEGAKKKKRKRKGYTEPVTQVVSPEISSDLVEMKEKVSSAIKDVEIGLEKEKMSKEIEATETKTRIEKMFQGVRDKFDQLVKGKEKDTTKNKDDDTTN